MALCTTKRGEGSRFKETTGPAGSLAALASSSLRNQAHRLVYPPPSLLQLSQHTSPVDPKRVPAQSYALPAYALLVPHLPCRGVEWRAAVPVLVAQARPVLQQQARHVIVPALNTHTMSGRYERYGTFREKEIHRSTGKLIDG